MSCSARLLIVLAVAACTEDPEVVQLSTRATMEIEIGPSQPEPISGDDVTYRWELVMHPDDSHASVPQGEAEASFLPDVRGVYVIERWIEYGLADRLTHEFVVDVAGMEPVPVVHGETSVPPGAPVVLDGSESHSAEGRQLIYQWRLAERPRDSAAELADTKQVTCSLVPDIPGEYVIELAVFDGELWSTGPASTTITAQ